METLISNELREFLGLRALTHNMISIKIDKVILYFDGDVIKKIISYEGIGEIYCEVDTEVLTQDKQWILPTTKRGKKHQLDSFHLGKIKHKGISIGIKLKSEYKATHLEIKNRYNNLGVDIPLPKTIKNVTDFVNYSLELMQIVPTHWSEMIASIKNTKKRIIHYKNGDIIQVALNWNKFAYGLIIGKFLDYRKSNIIPKDHPYTHIMCVPVVLRFFDFLTDNPMPTLEELRAIPLQSPVIVMDNTILQNTHRVILHKDLKKEDILFPMHCSILFKSSKPNDNSCGYHVNDNEHLNHLISLGYKPQLSLAWGFAMKTKGTSDLIKLLPPYDEYRTMSNTAIGLLDVTDQGNKPHISYADFINYPERKNIFKYFEVDPDISFDEFNLQYNGYTKEEYLDYLKDKCFLFYLYL